MTENYNDQTDKREKAASEKKMHKDFQEYCEKQVCDRYLAYEAHSRTLAQEERDQATGDIELQSRLKSAKHPFEENTKKKYLCEVWRCYSATSFQRRLMNVPSTMQRL